MSSVPYGLSALTVIIPGKSSRCYVNVSLLKPRKWLSLCPTLWCRNLRVINPILRLHPLLVVFFPMVVLSTHSTLCKPAKFRGYIATLKSELLASCCAIRLFSTPVLLMLLRPILRTFWVRRPATLISYVKPSVRTSRLPRTLRTLVISRMRCLRARLLPNYDRRLIRLRALIKSSTPT